MSASTGFTDPAYNLGIAPRIHSLVLDGKTEYLGWQDCLDRFSVATSDTSAVVAVAGNAHNATQPIYRLDRAQMDDDFVNSFSAWTCPGMQQLGLSSDYGCKDHAIGQDGRWDLVEPVRNVNGFLGPPDVIQIDHCERVPAEQHCAVDFHAPLMAVVIACNLVKAVCFVLTLNTIKRKPLVTIGDAVASFLARPGSNDSAFRQLEAHQLMPLHATWLNMLLNRFYRYMIQTRRRADALSTARLIMTVTLLE